MHNEMVFVRPRPEDTVLAYDGRSVLARSPVEGSSETDRSVMLRFPTVTECSRLPTGGQAECTYLFAIDDQRFFLGLCPHRDFSIPVQVEGFRYLPLAEARGFGPRHLNFACMTGYQLYCWYRDNQFCGRCGAPMRLDGAERAIRCDACGNKVYPRLVPAVIVAVVDGDRILLSRYAHGEYRRYALIAGFCEIGETAEETVAREVMEETGVHVKNVRYYKSQPWGIVSDLLLGYFCELDGSPEITLADGELSEALWVSRSEMDGIADDHYSLTREMMTVFKKRRLPFL
jgi:NAD+ diphosphatase